MGLIYKITNKINGKLYVGLSSVSAEVRWREHCSDSKSSLAKRHSTLHLAMRKYRIENFVMEVLEDGISDGLLEAKEVEWIARLESANREKGYNRTYGGCRCVHSPDSKSRIKGIDRRSPEARARQAAAIRGRKLSPERKEALRLTRVGYKASPETIAKMKTCQAHRWTPEYRAAWGEKQRQIAAERKARANGKINPKLSEAMQRIWAERRANGKVKEWSDRAHAINARRKAAA